MKSIVVRILVALLTFFIGWSCATVKLILFPRRVLLVYQPKADEIDRGPVSVETVPVAPRNESFRPDMYWDGYVQRGKARIRASGSAGFVEGISVSRVHEQYESADAARYVLSRTRGKWRSASEVAPLSVGCEFKVLERRNSVRIGWVSGTDLHFLETSKYSAAMALLASWGDFSCK